MVDLAEGVRNVRTNPFAGTVGTFEVRESRLDILIALAEPVIVRITEVRGVLLVIGNVGKTDFSGKTGKLPASLAFQ